MHKSGMQGELCTSVAKLTEVDALRFSCLVNNACHTCHHSMTSDVWMTDTDCVRSSTIPAFQLRLSLWYSDRAGPGLRLWLRYHQGHMLH